MRIGSPQDHRQGMVTEIAGESASVRSCVESRPSDGGQLYVT